MPKNNFKLFDENKSNMMTDDDYVINQQRLNGVQSGVASSQLQNKTLYQTALVSYALAQIMAANGYDANDADAVSTFVNNMSQTLVQKVKDRASLDEAISGSNIAKYISPDIFINSLKYLTIAKYGPGDPTVNTQGMIGQLYINTDTQAAFYCSGHSENTYVWHRIARVRAKAKTEFITSSKNWTVPAGTTTVLVRMFGGGGGGGDHNQSSYGYGGGGGGEMAVGTIDVTPGDVIYIKIGHGGAAGSDGETTMFGDYLSANGGKRSANGNGGDGGSGGGGSCLTQSSCKGGTGFQFGGGGAGGSKQKEARNNNGGNGGEYGGGGGGGYTDYFNFKGSTGGTGGTYGGNGGGVTKDGTVSSANAGTDTRGLGLEFMGAGNAGAAGNKGGGGGGGYGGNGGNGGVNAGGGGGGYGADGGNGGENYHTNNNDYAGGGGGGGYGGKGGDAGNNGRGGGGGGYGVNNYGAGGNGFESGKDGCAIITYESFELY